MFSPYPCRTMLSQRSPDLASLFQGSFLHFSGLEIYSGPSQNRAAYQAYTVADVVGWGNVRVDQCFHCDFILPHRRKKALTLHTALYFSYAVTGEGKLNLDCPSCPGDKVVNKHGVSCVSVRKWWAYRIQSVILGVWILTPFWCHLERHCVTLPECHSNPPCRPVLAAPTVPSDKWKVKLTRKQSQWTLSCKSFFIYFFITHQ